MKPPRPKAFDGAKWIWADGAFGENVYADFFFDVPFSSGDDITLFISCDHRYALYVGGAFFDCGQFSDMPKFKVYDKIDLSGVLKEGKNSVTVSCWHEGRETACSCVQPHGVIFSLEKNGRKIISSSKEILSRKNTAYREENVGSNQIGLNSVFDATAPLPARAPSVEVEGPAKIYPRPNLMPELSEATKTKLVYSGAFEAGERDEKNHGKTPYFALVRPGSKEKKPRFLPDKEGIKLTGEKDGCFALFDIGAETVGLLKLKIVLEQEADVYISWGEHIDDGRVRSWIGGRNFTRVCRFAAGETEYIYPFRRAGLRYVQLNVFAPSCTLKECGVIPVEYPLDKSGYFSCSDSLHEKIYLVSRRTLELCMHEHYEDCPWREQALYAMDSRNQMLCGYYAFGETRFAKSSLTLFPKTIRSDGLMEMTAPTAHSRPIPSFNAVFFVALNEYLLFSGDKDFAYSTLEEAKSVLDAFESRMNNGLVEIFEEGPYWNYYEWQKGLYGGISLPDGKAFPDAPLNAFASLAFAAAANILSANGDGRAAHYETLSKTINKTLWERFFVPEEGAIAARITDGKPDCFAQLTQALAVCCGAVPEDQIDGILAKTVSGDLLPATLSHSVFLYDALMKRPEKYAKFVIEDIASRWGKMLLAGATSFWETEDGADAFSYAGSLCHGWSAVPVYVYFRYVLGLYPGGAKKIDCGLTGVDGKAILFEK
ncbi:MAG: hypothetical protein IJV00_05410 [Clostridia bacterium]|nr:hypothetical protein [Clostridia bacterium]